eukprot:5037134-Prymnesium_polylepis.2
MIVDPQWHERSARASRATARRLPAWRHGPCMALTTRKAKVRHHIMHLSCTHLTAVLGLAVTTCLGYLKGSDRQSSNVVVAR